MKGPPQTNIVPKPISVIGYPKSANYKRRKLVWFSAEKGMTAAEYWAQSPSNRFGESVVAGLKAAAASDSRFRRIVFLPDCHEALPTSLDRRLALSQLRLFKSELQVLARWPCQPLIQLLHTHARHQTRATTCFLVRIRECVPIDPRAGDEGG